MRPSRLTAVLSLLACSVGCQIGDPPLTLGEALRVTRCAPQDSEGMDCDAHSTNCGVPVNRPVSLQFNRWLRPNTATRQSIQLHAEHALSAQFTLPKYELLTRTVTYSVSVGLDQGLVYVLEFVDPKAQPNGSGFVAYDDQPIERDSLTNPVLFRTGKADSTIGNETVPVRRCRDALEAFSKAGCTRAACHRSENDTSPAARLWLDDKSGLKNALGRVAVATDRGGDSGKVSVMPERFGVNLPVIDAGEPAFSFLLYRLLFGRDAYRNDLGQFEVSPPSPTELSFATTWFGAMGPMPPESVGFSADASPVELVRVIESWIREGADTEQCD